MNLNRELRHHHTKALTVGHDGVASFTIAVYVENGQAGHCDRCDQNCFATIKYHGGKDNGITAGLWNRYRLTVDKTLLKEADNVLGIDCGCYARFQRQLAHIADSAVQKGL